MEESVYVQLSEQLLIFLLLSFLCCCSFQFIFSSITRFEFLVCIAVSNAVIVVVVVIALTIGQCIYWSLHAIISFTPPEHFVCCSPAAVCVCILCKCVFISLYSCFTSIHSTSFNFFSSLVHTLLYHADIFISIRFFSSSSLFRCQSEASFTSFEYNMCYFRCALGFFFFFHRHVFFFQNRVTTLISLFAIHSYSRESHESHEVALGAQSDTFFHLLLCKCVSLAFQILISFYFCIQFATMFRLIKNLIWQMKCKKLQFSFQTVIFKFFWNTRMALLSIMSVVVISFFFVERKPIETFLFSGKGPTHRISVQSSHFKTKEVETIFFA